METPIIDEFRQGLTQIRTGVEQTQHDVTDLSAALKEVQREHEQTRTQLDQLRKTQLAGGGRPILRAGQVVSEACARHLASIFILSAEAQGKLQDHKQRESLLGMACEFLGIQQRAALTSSDIPLPTDFSSEVVELVWKYGQFRQYATVYPLGALATKLPRLKTSPAFGVIAQSGAVTEKSPQFEWVTFTAFKSGGIVRVPSEIDADSIVALGQFLARYIAREMAKWEDTVGYLGDGTATYGSVSGIGKKSDTFGNKLQLAATKTKPSDITLADLRNLRTKVEGAALRMGAYYMHPSMEGFLAGLNSATNLTPYVASGPNGPRLDGFPIRWIGVMPIYDTIAHVNQYQVYFGDQSYWYFGERSSLDIQVSRDVYFTSDEVGIRALERFDIQLMADAATTVLQLAAS
jgi:HK97 family phage major capsid protein